MNVPSVKTFCNIHMLCFEIIAMITAISGSSDTLSPGMTATHLEAIEYCRLIGSKLSLPNGQSDPEWAAIKKEMGMRRWNTMWLSLKLHQLDNATWIDGTIPAKDALIGCGYIDMKTKKLSSTDCVATEIARICQYKDCFKCPSGITIEQCHVMNGTCFTKHVFRTDWFTARRRCQLAGADLAIFETDSVLDALVEVFADPDSFNIKYWVGLRSKDWQLIVDNQTYVLSPLDSKWLMGEPKEGSQCAVASSYGLVYGWQAVHCTDRFHFKCFRHGSANTATTTQLHLTSPDNTDESRKSDGRLAGVIVPAVLSLIFFGFIIGVGVLKYQKKKEPSVKEISLPLGRRPPLPPRPDEPDEFTSLVGDGLPTHGDEPVGATTEGYLNPQGQRQSYTAISDGESESEEASPTVIYILVQTNRESDRLDLDINIVGFSVYGQKKSNGTLKTVNMIKKIKIPEMSKGQVKYQLEIDVQGSPWLLQGEQNPPMTGFIRQGDQTLEKQAVYHLRKDTDDENETLHALMTIFNSGDETNLRLNLPIPKEDTYDTVKPTEEFSSP